MIVPLIGQLTVKTVSGAMQQFQNVHFFAYEGLNGRRIKTAAQEGFEVGATPGSGNGTAIKVWSGGGNNVVSAFGDTNSTIYNALSSLGSITGTAKFITETSISGTANIFITTGLKGYFYPSGGAITEITDGDFPANNSLTLTGPFVHFSGFNGIMCTNGEFYHSDLNSASGWTSTAKLTAQTQPDPGVAAIQHRDFIILFGQKTYEPHYNAGNASGAVISRVAGAQRQVGLINQYAVVPFMDTIAWAGTQAGVGVFLMDGLEPKRISTAPVETVMRNAVSTTRLHVLTSWGRPRLLVVSSANDNDGFLYDPYTGMWTYTSFGAINITQADTVQSSAVHHATVFVGANNDGKWYRNSNVGASSVILTTDFMDFGTGKRKTANSMRILGDSQGSSVTVSVKWTDVDGGTYGPSTAKTIVVGSSTPSLLESITNLGTFRRRSFELTWDGSTTGAMQALESIELDLEQCDL
jgi:hypothetical protein